MKLVSLNIERNRHLNLVLDFIPKENADVVCLQEVLEEDFPKFEKAFALKGVFCPWAYITDGLYYDLIGKKQGVAIFSNNIIASDAVFYEGQASNVSMTDTYNKALLWADILIAGETFRVVTTQLPVTEKGAVTDYQLKTINSLLEKLKDLGELILCGDMNAPRGRESFTLLANTFKDNIPLEYKTSIDQNLHKVKGIQLMVDGLFTTNNYKVQNVVLKDSVSDHMAVVAEIDTAK